MFTSHVLAAGEMVAVPLITAKGDFVAQPRDHEERLFDEHPVISITPLGLSHYVRFTQHGTLRIVRNPVHPAIPIADEARIQSHVEPLKLEVGINILPSDSEI